VDDDSVETEDIESKDDVVAAIKEEESSIIDAVVLTPVDAAYSGRISG
jgi:hypothetical protein